MIDRIQNHRDFHTLGDQQFRDTFTRLKNMVYGWGDEGVCTLDEGMGDDERIATVEPGPTINKLLDTGPGFSEHFFNPKEVFI